MRNSAYNEVAEFEGLPPLVQKAIGSSGNLHSMAIDENYNEGVARSNFLRQYQIVCERKREEQRRYAMKEIIIYNSSSRGAELKDCKSPAVEEMLVDLQIVTKIKNLLGENLPGTKFEAVEVQFDYFDRRRIIKMAS